MNTTSDAEFYQRVNHISKDTISQIKCIKLSQVRGVNKLLNYKTRDTD